MAIKIETLQPEELSEALNRLEFEAYIEENPKGNIKYYQDLLDRDFYRDEEDLLEGTDFLTYFSDIADKEEAVNG